MKKQKQIAVAMVAIMLLSALMVPVVMSRDARATLGDENVPTETCKRVFFSTEEEFITRGPEPPDGNPIISGGDLLGPGCVVFARNRELLAAFKTEIDLGLDAADVIDAKKPMVAFSTELDDPRGRFTAGDLLATNGAVIPNIALLAKFDIPRADFGLDAVYFIGDIDHIGRFLDYATKVSRDEWLEKPGMLPGMLGEYKIDIWFSTEGTAPKPEAPLFLDGDLLSACMGTIVAANADLLPSIVPAGIPDRGVDFGLDAVIADRSGDKERIHFSTKILYEGKPSFTDGDLLRIGNGVVCANEDLIRCFEPKANFLGLDALSIAVKEEKPDLVIKDIKLTKMEGYCYVDYLISNTGTASVSASTTYLYVDGKKVASDSTGALATGASRWDRFTYRATSTHTFKVCADGPNAISESNEANNCRTEKLTCPPPIPVGNILYHANHGAGIWRMNPDGSGKTQLSDHGWFAEYSPDNTKIAFGDFYQNGIWVMNADGTNQKQLTKSGNAPTWSPDGKKIAYHDGDTEGKNRRIWVMNADGTNAHQLSKNPSSFPKWSPNGKKIAYHGEVNNGIWLINPDGTGETQLYTLGGYPAWSPGGKKIAYVSLTDWYIWTMNADGTGKTKLTDRKGIHPTWSSDATKIAYEDLANNKGIWVINADGSGDHMINKEGHAPDWSNEQ